MPKIVLGCDGFGFELKEAVRQHLQAARHEVVDLGVRSPDEPQPYYEIAAQAARRLVSGDAWRAVLVCGTGMGMAIIANKFSGVYAAVCENRQAAVHARSINNANVLTLGGMVTPAGTARDIVDSFLATEFAAGWDPPIQEFLHKSMPAIRELESSVR